MNQKPRRQHFVPQFWIKKFISEDVKLWGYDWNDDNITQRSPKSVMQIFNLYTIEPGGVDDTSLETIDLSVIDKAGADVFERVLSGDYDETVRVELANFLAAQIMRDPGTVGSYPTRAQNLALALLDAGKAEDYASFAAALATQFPGARLSEDEFDKIRNLPAAEQVIDNIISMLDAPGGCQELPFTDLIRDPKGRDIVRDVLLGLDWQIKNDPKSGFILGDAAVLYDKSDLRSGVRTPLSKTTALYLKPSETPRQGIASSSASPHDVDGLNNESAARARLWLVGEKARIDKVRKQVGAHSWG